MDNAAQGQLKEDKMKELFYTMIAAIGTVAAYLFGGWSQILTILLLLMGVDYLSGLIVAGVFHASEKTENGGLESRAGWKGLCRKGMTLAVVWVAGQIDIMLGTGYFKDGVALAFALNEILSIIENAGLMGVPIPDILRRAIEILKNKSDGEGV